MFFKTNVCVFVLRRPLLQQHKTAFRGLGEREKSCLYVVVQNVPFWFLSIAPHGQFILTHLEQPKKREDAASFLKKKTCLNRSLSNDKSRANFFNDIFDNGFL